MSNPSSMNVTPIERICCFSMVKSLPDLTQVELQYVIFDEMYRKMWSRCCSVEFSSSVGAPKRYMLPWKGTKSNENHPQLNSRTTHSSFRRPRFQSHAEIDICFRIVKTFYPLLLFSNHIMDVISLKKYYDSSTIFKSLDFKAISSILATFAFALGEFPVFMANLGSAPGYNRMIDRYFAASCQQRRSNALWAYQR